MMTSYSDIERKIYLIKASLDSELGEDDRKELNEWLRTSEENQEMYDRFRNKRLLSERLGFYRQTDPEPDWKEIRRRTQRISRHERWLQRLTYAAVFIGLLFMVSLYIYRQKAEIPLPENIAINCDSIRPGSRQAYIELVTGEKIVLGEREKGLVKNVDGGMLKEGVEGLIMVGDDSVENEVQEVEFNRVVVPRGGEYRLILADGTKVWMNSDSKFEFPTVFTGKERRVRLQGEAYFQVQRNEKMPFRIEVNGIEVAVLGTSFNIQAYGELMYTTLVEGAVALNVGGDTFRLSPGEEAKVNKRKVRVQKVDVYERIAWKEGKFVFREKRLEEVMEILGRWYDVEICYRNTAVKDLHFTGNIPRHATISEVLQFLERTRLVHFSIAGRTVIVSA